MAALGIDIGGSSIKLALASGDQTFTAQSPRYARPSAAQLQSALQAALTSLGPGASSPVSIGLCAPGVIDPVTLRVAASINLPGLVGASLRELVFAALGRELGRLHACSDAHAAAHDFWSASAPRPAGRLMAISLGTGVGACVLDDGLPLRVTGASSGHLGQIDVSLAEPGHVPPIGPDGGAGSLEGYIGLPALLARYGDDPMGVLTRLGASELPIRALVRVLRIGHAFYRPDHIVLLGGVGVRLAPLLATIRTGVETHLTSLARPGWTLQCGTSDFHAALGAARLGAEAR
ncbi:MAG: ROK family protein [Polaromonas sp.]